MAPFEEVDLTPHLGGDFISTDAISASDDAFWALGAKDLFRVESDGTVERVLRAPGTHIFHAPRCERSHRCRDRYEGPVRVA